MFVAMYLYTYVHVFIYVGGVHKSTSLMSSSLLLQAVSCMSGSSNLNSFRDRWQVAVQWLSCGMLPPGLVRDCTQHAKAGRPARTYIQQLCEDTGCCPEDLPRAMNDREEWRERVRDIRATSATWWWWLWFIYACDCINTKL